ncbi:MAG: nucleotidyltransferase domain-containing protein [Planctomycetota bacterium]
MLDDFKWRVSARLPLHRIVLFGSRARGDADADSDVDVLVVLDCPVDSSSDQFVSHCAWEAGYEHGIVVTPVVFSRDEWENGPESYSLLAIAVRQEGIEV